MTVERASVLAIHDVLAACERSEYGSIKDIVPGDSGLV